MAVKSAHLRIEIRYYIIKIIFEQVPATIDKTRMRTDGLKCGLIIQERKNDIITYRVSTRMVGLKDNVLITWYSEKF